MENHWNMIDCTYKGLVH